MHYRNGREAKNGGKIVKLEGGKIVSFGVLHSARRQRTEDRMTEQSSLPEQTPPPGAP